MGYEKCVFRALAWNNVGDVDIGIIFLENKCIYHKEDRVANLKDLFDKDIFELLHLSDIPQEQKDYLLEKLEEGIQKRVITRIATMITDEQAKQFGELANKNDVEGMKKFFVDNNIDVVRVAAEEGMRYRVELVELIDIASGNE